MNPYSGSFIGNFNSINTCSNNTNTNYGGNTVLFSTNTINSNNNNSYKHHKTITSNPKSSNNKSKSPSTLTSCANKPHDKKLPEFDEEETEFAILLSLQPEYNQEMVQHKDVKSGANEEMKSGANIKKLPKPWERPRSNIDMTANKISEKASFPRNNNNASIDQWDDGKDEEKKARIETRGGSANTDDTSNIMNIHACAQGKDTNCDSNKEIKTRANIKDIIRYKPWDSRPRSIIGVNSYKSPDKESYRGNNNNTPNYGWDDDKEEDENETQEEQKGLSNGCDTNVRMNSNESIQSMPSFTMTFRGPENYYNPPSIEPTPDCMPSPLFQAERQKAKSNGNECDINAVDSGYASIRYEINSSDEFTNNDNEAFRDFNCKSNSFDVNNKDVFKPKGKDEQDEYIPVLSE